MKTSQQLVVVSLSLVILLLLDSVVDVNSARVQYQYKKYTYRKKRDVSLIMHHF